MIPAPLKVVVLGLGLAALFLAIAAPQPPPWDGRIFREVRSLDGQLVGQPAPPLQLTRLDGTPFDLASLRGKVVFLNLWATWCKPCRDEIPSMVALATALAGEHERFEMVAVSWDEDAETVQSFLTAFPELAERVTLVLDPGGERSMAFGTRLLPETYVIDAEGRVVARFVSLRDWSSSSSVALLTALIRQKSGR